MVPTRIAVAVVIACMLGAADGAEADERIDRFKDLARKHLDKPYLLSPFPCEDGWLAGETGYVLDVIPWAEASGLRRGDRFITIGGESVADAGHWGMALARSARGTGRLDVVVDRAGVVQSLRLPCRSAAETWTAEREILKAVVVGDWDRCIAAAQAFMSLIRRAFAVILRVETHCLAAKIQAEKIPARSPLAERYRHLLHRAASADLEAARYQPGGLTAVRSGIGTCAECHREALVYTIDRPPR